MTVGDLVLLKGGLWSSYANIGQVAILLETEIPGVGQVLDGELSRVLLQDGIVKLYKTEHLEVVNESNSN